MRLRLRHRRRQADTADRSGGPVAPHASTSTFTFTSGDAATGATRTGSWTIRTGTGGPRGSSS
ncbi:hypothetical protein, partial [Actinomadura soli]|uniref:hypothetical protein n=1 Tax=Actinomadura soli TaxID=2508997 RepID=UPI00197AFF74